MAKTTVLLVDDHPLFRAGVSASLAAQPDFDVVLEASTLAEAREIATANGPDVVVLDITLPDGSGLDAIPWFVGLTPPVPVIMMSVHSSGEFVRSSFRNGASAYLTKGSADTELHAALRAVADGGVYASVEVAAALIDREQSDRSDYRSALTRREVEVTVALADGLTTTEVADELGVSPKTVEAHKASIYRKLSVRNVSELTRLVVESRGIPLNSTTGISGL